MADFVAGFVVEVVVVVFGTVVDVEADVDEGVFVSVEICPLAPACAISSSFIVLFFVIAVITVSGFLRFKSFNNSSSLVVNSIEILFPKII